MPKPGSRHIVESAARPPGGARKKGTGGGAARRKGVCSERASHRRDNARSLPLRNIVPAAHADVRDNARPAPAFSGQSRSLRATALCNDAVQRDAAASLAASAVLGGRSRSQSSRPASIAQISVEAVKSLKPKIADGTRITAVLRYTASSIHLLLWSSPFL
jgi:hypothetical protein